MNYITRTASLNNMLLKNLWNDKIEQSNINLLATALTCACPTERLGDMFNLIEFLGNVMVFLMTNDKIMDSLIC